MNEQCSAVPLPVIFSALSSIGGDDISVNNNANLKAIITPSIVVAAAAAVIAENTRRKQTPSDSDFPIRNKQQEKERESEATSETERELLLGETEEESQHPPAAVMFCVREWGRKEGR